ncbi:MAG: hypothetical protein ACREH4_03570 [Vitreimonas sp.]
MAMQAASLEVLEKANVPAPQARAFVQAIEIELLAAKDTLATKHDIAELRQELRQEIAGVRGEIGGLRGEVADVRRDLELKIDTVRNELRVEIHAVASSLSRQMYTAMLGQMAVLLGIAYFFVTQVLR